MTIENETITIDHSGEARQESAEDLNRQRRILFIAGIVGILILALVIAGVIFLIQPTTDTERIRDIFIIFMALESLLLGLVLIILIVQIARLTNLMQNEIKPILESTNETISTLRGTTNFLSENLVQPVITLNGYMAALQQMITLFGLTRKRNRSS